MLHEQYTGFRRISSNLLQTMFKALLWCKYKVGDVQKVYTNCVNSGVDSLLSPIVIKEEQIDGHNDVHINGHNDVHIDGQDGGEIQECLLIFITEMCVCLSICQNVCLSVGRSVCLSLSYLFYVCLYICLDACLSVRRSVCLCLSYFYPVCISTFSVVWLLYVGLSFCSSVIFLSVLCLSLHLSGYLVVST